MRQNRPQRVVLLTPPGPALLLGAGRFATTDRRWVFEIVDPSPRGFEQVMADPPDGVIAYGRDNELLARLAQRCPVVNHSGNLLHSAVPRVRLDDEAVGRLAAEHLMSLGFAELGCVWFSDATFALRRRDGFMAAAREAGRPAHRFDMGPTVPVDARHRDRAGDAAMLDWLMSLPRPIALFGINDTVGWRLAAICFEAGIHVPEQVAILGVDNQAGICQLCRPQLSSIAVSWESIGYRCAALLDQLMSGQPAPEGDVLVPPVGVVARQSTDALAIDDPKIAEALRFIRQFAHQGIDVDEVADHAGLPRRTLEHRFRKLINRTPLDEVRRVRVELVKELMHDPHLSLEAIAERAGFSSVRWMSQVFHDLTGQTPGRYRKALVDTSWR